MYNVVSTLAPSYLIGACNKDRYKSLDGFEIRQYMTLVYRIKCPWTSEKNLLRLNMGEMLWAVSVSAFSFEWIFIIIAAGNKGNHKSFNEFEFLLDPITNYWVDCPWVFEKWMYCCEHSSTFILIRSYSFLQVIWAAIKAWMSLKFSKIGPGSMELAAIHLKNLHRLIIGVMLWAL